MFKKERKKDVIYLANYTVFVYLLIYLFTTLALNKDFHSRNNLYNCVSLINS